jgi:hypothetical protein
MQKIFLALAALAAAGCSSSPFRNAPEQASASLSIPKSAGTYAPNRLGGLFAIDGHPVAAQNRNSVFLSAGSHKISFLCPGWMYVDGFPSLRHKFSIGKKYELSCSSGAVEIILLGGV